MVQTRVVWNTPMVLQVTMERRYVQFLSITNKTTFQTQYIFVFFIQKKVKEGDLVHIKFFFKNHFLGDSYIILKIQLWTKSPYVKYFWFFVFWMFFLCIFFWVVIMTVMSMKFSCKWIFFFFSSKLHFFWNMLSRIRYH